MTETIHCEWCNLPTLEPGGNFAVDDWRQYPFWDGAWKDDDHMNHCPHCGSDQFIEERSSGWKNAYVEGDPVMDGRSGTAYYDVCTRCGTGPA